MFGSPDWIVKIERPGWSGVAREAAAFPTMRRLGFDEFPEVVATHADLDDVVDDDSPAFLLMRRAHGRPFDELWREDRSLAVWTVERIGDFLRRLATVDWRVVPGVVTPEERIRDFPDFFTSFLAPLVDAGEGERVERLIDAMRVPPTGFGGWQFVQAFTDGRSTFTAIDWGNLGAFWPCHDLAAAVCSLDDFGADAAPLLRPVLLGAFGGLDDDAQRQLDQWLDLWICFDQAGRLHQRRTAAR